MLTSRITLDQRSHASRTPAASAANPPHEHDGLLWADLPNGHTTPCPTGCPRQPLALPPCYSATLPDGEGPAFDFRRTLRPTAPVFVSYGLVLVRVRGRSTRGPLRYSCTSGTALFHIPIPALGGGGIPFFVPWATKPKNGVLYGFIFVGPEIKIEFVNTNRGLIRPLK